MFVWRTFPAELGVIWESSTRKCWETSGWKEGRFWVVKVKTSEATWVFMMGLSTPTLRLRDGLCLGAGDLLCSCHCLPLCSLCASALAPSSPWLTAVFQSLPCARQALLCLSRGCSLCQSPLSLTPSPLGLLQPVLTGPVPDQPSQITLCFAAQHRLVHG